REERREPNDEEGEQEARIRRLRDQLPRPHGQPGVAVRCHTDRPRRDDQEALELCEAQGPGHEALTSSPPSRAADPRRPAPQLCEPAIADRRDGPLTASNHIDTLGAKVSIRMVTSGRDPVRTRERILRAARREFVAKGFAGARVDAIARSAAVNKRMLYHYFGDKEALYRAVLREGIATNLDLVAAAPADPDDLLPFLFTRVLQRRDGIRLMQWEALGAGERKPIAEEERRKAWVEGAERLRDAQRAGRLHQDLEAECLVLALMALTIFPLAFPQVVHMVTGARPSDAEFQQRQARFLRCLGTHLRPPSLAAKVVRASQSKEKHR